MSEIDSTRFKKCCKCKCTKPASLSFFTKKGKGLGSYCRVCATLYSVDYNRRNKERLKPMVRASRKRYEKRNLEKRAKLKRDWYKRNPEKAKAYMDKWKMYNREKWNSYVRNIYAARMRAPGNHTEGEILQMYEDQQGLCAYCETPLFGTYHVEHMLPLSRGCSNDWTNLAISCPSCNTSKRTLTAEEFMSFR